MRNCRPCKGPKQLDVVDRPPAQQQQQQQQGPSSACSSVQQGSGHRIQYYLHRTTCTACLCRQDLVQAKQGIGELFSRVADIKRKAEASEAMVQVSCKEGGICPIRLY